MFKPLPKENTMACKVCGLPSETKVCELCSCEYYEEFHPEEHENSLYPKTDYELDTDYLCSLAKEKI